MFSCAIWAQAPATTPAKPAAAKPKPAATAPAKPGTPGAKAAAKPAAAAANPNDPVVLTVGAEKLTKSQFDGIISVLPANAQAQMASPEGKRKFAERVAEIMTLSQEARRRRLDEKASYRTQIRLTQDNLLASALYQEVEEKTVVPPADVQKYYDEHKSEYETAEARHILIRFKDSRVPLKEGQKDLTDEEALAKTKELRERIAKGEDFAAVAKAESDDTGSGAQGGSLGEFGHGRMVKVFEDAAFTLPVGQVSEPVKSDFGYHLIEVQKRGTKPLAEVQDDIEKQLRTDLARKTMEAITNATTPVMDEAYFGSPAPEQPAAPAQPPAAPQQ